jgi:hypothetical protein
VASTSITLDRSAFAANLDRSREMLSFAALTMAPAFLFFIKLSQHLQIGGHDIAEVKPASQDTPLKWVH